MVLKLSLRTRLLLLVLFATLPAVVIVYATGRELEKSIIRNAEQEALRQVLTMAMQHERVVNHARLLLETLARTSEVRNLDISACQELLRELRTRNPAYVTLSLADTHGNILVSSPDKGSRQAYKNDAFAQALRVGGFATGHYALEPATEPASPERPGHVVISFAQPVWPVIAAGASSEITAVLCASFDLVFFSRLFEEMQLPVGSIFTLTDARGIRLARFPSASEYTWVPDLPRMVKRMTGAAEEGAFQDIGVDGQLRLYGFKRLHFEGAPFPYLLIRLGIPVEQALAEARQTMQRSLFFLSTAASLSLLLTWIFGELALLSPLRRLIAAAGRLEAGDLHARTGLSRQEAEIGRLASAFDAMAEGLERREEARLQAMAQIQTLNEQLEERVIQRTQELEQAYARLLEMDRMKSELLSHVSHELKTPVTSIYGFAKLVTKRLAKSVLPALPQGDEQLAREARQIQENMAFLRQDAERLSEITRNVIDLTELEFGDARLSRESVSPAEIARQAAAERMASYQEKGLALRVEVADQLPRVLADPVRLLQVLDNLLSNACKFTSQGGVVLRVSRTGDTVLFEVEDSGQGIREKDQGRIFDTFVQLGDPLTGKPPGLGLGLALCRAILARHGSVMKMRSTHGTGSCFFFSLPGEDATE